MPSIRSLGLGIAAVAVAALVVVVVLVLVLVLVAIVLARCGPKEEHGQAHFVGHSDILLSLLDLQYKVQRLSVDKQIRLTTQSEAS